MNQGKKKMKRENGFTMVEILVSTVIFSLGILSLGQVFVLGVNTINQTKFQIRANNLARQLMEEIESKAFDETMVGQDPTEKRDPSSFTDYKVSGNPESGFPRDQAENQNNRGTLDDIDDYANYSTNSMQEDRNFKCSITVVYAQDNNLNGPASTTRTNYKRIKVTISSLTTDKSAVLTSIAYYRGM